MRYFWILMLAVIVFAWPVMAGNHGTTYTLTISATEAQVKMLLKGFADEAAIIAYLTKDAAHTLQLYVNRRVATESRQEVDTFVGLSTSARARVKAFLALPASEQSQRLQ